MSVIYPKEIMNSFLQISIHLKDVLQLLQSTNMKLCAVLVVTS